MIRFKDYKTREFIKLLGFKFEKVNLNKFNSPPIVGNLYGEFRITLIQGKPFLFFDINEYGTLMTPGRVIRRQKFLGLWGHHSSLRDHFNSVDPEAPKDINRIFFASEETATLFLKRFHKKKFYISSVQYHFDADKTPRKRLLPNVTNILLK